MLKELLSTDGKLSTTSTVQFIGALCVFGLTVYAVVTGQPYAESLLNNVLIYLFGATTAKGVVTSYQAKIKGAINGQITGVSESRKTA
ncbi:DUF2644 domain-containing protein [Necropsobacter massiliensis]|uniref:DUF2644 domain-containing protein n=1 Tax=Necropsobacter massiliensis TaxID=1400001 RepID=UPI0005958DF8|nr:DUF2644 domain-containing protein [Necropsobacter massiliensis]